MTALCGEAMEGDEEKEREAHVVAREDVAVGRLADSCRRARESISICAYMPHEHAPGDS